jgi:hypothetical protein
VKRKLTAGERDRIARNRPWFGRGRRSADDDLASGEAEIIHFSVLRFWDVNGCQPPCCPRALILQTTDDRFLHLESWSVLPASNELGRDCIVHRASVSKTLLTFEMSGQPISAEQDSARDGLLGFAAAECEWVDTVDFPAEFRRIAGIK